jgi:hypothetical protein
MTHGDGGKGSQQRPTNYKSFSEHFDNIFRKQDDAKAEDDEFERIQREQEQRVGNHQNDVRRST